MFLNDCGNVLRNRGADQCILHPHAAHDLAHIGLFRLLIQQPLCQHLQRQAEQKGSKKIALFLVPQRRDEHLAHLLVAIVLAVLDTEITDLLLFEDVFELATAEPLHLATPPPHFPVVIALHQPWSQFESVGRFVSWANFLGRCEKIPFNIDQSDEGQQPRRKLGGIGTIFVVSITPQAKRRRQTLATAQGRACWAATVG